MRNEVANFKNIPIRSSFIESIYPNVVAKNQKVVELEKAGEIIRLKKGLYVVNPKESGHTLSIELIANHLYSPSYISMSSALRYYGLIPEAVYTTQSMTIKHSRVFENSLGIFQFTYIPRKVFHIGITTVGYDNVFFLIATPEKALCDLIANTPKLNLRYLKDVQQYLEEDIRFDMDALEKMDIGIFQEYVNANGKKANSIRTLIKFIHRFIF